MLTSKIAGRIVMKTLCAIGFLAAAMPNAVAEVNACLIISEVVMGAESGGHPRWIEITNTGYEDYLFTEGGVIVQLDDDTDLTVDVDLTGTTIPSGSSYVICQDVGAYYGVYFTNPDLDTEARFGDGNDRYILTDTADGSHLLDTYGELGVNGTGTAWEYTLGYAYRLSSVNDGNGGVFNPSEWYFGGVDSLVGPDPAALLQAFTDPQRHTWDLYCVPCFGDLNGDLLITISDLAQLLGHYGMTSGATYFEGDFNGDGDVDLSDLATLLGLYGTGC